MAAVIEGLLAEQGLSHADLANRLGVTSARVRQILAGEADLTVRSLAMLAEGLRAQVEIRFLPRPANGARADQVHEGHQGHQGHDGDEGAGEDDGARQGTVLARGR
ncbi:helix-turn-helix domain-containing protein [Streptomyces sp. NBC_01190]|uniref:helix-turn-helix domain-containing protein n=1 Tax=Streptomyces sp. NBC_01190 TaxID=2903767 RepID=UPI00386587E9|nr:helix-turn-helix transcriptional regulator [Streptomyces sp. NBC_01190]